MEAERRLQRQWAHRSLHVAIAIGGLAAIIGSGGGGLGGFSVPCPPGICQDFVWVEVEPRRLTAQLGQTVSFRAVESGTISASQFQWCRYAPGASTCDAIAGATGSSLTVANVNLADDQARYQVTASGGGSSRAASAQLLVSTAPAVVFEDGDFPDAGWTSAGFAGYPPATPSPAFRVSRPTADGNPGAYRAVEYGPLSPGAPMYVTHAAQAATYDPGQLGAIHSIDFRAECRVLSGFGPRMYARPLLRQGARTYSSDPLWRQSCEGTGWSFDASRGSLVASDFSQVVDGPACGAGETCPDFSAAGAPITFGMLTGSDFVDPTTTASHGVDNWRIGVWRR